MNRYSVENMAYRSGVCTKKTFCETASADHSLWLVPVSTDHSVCYYINRQKHAKNQTTTTKNKEPGKTKHTHTHTHTRTHTHTNKSKPFEVNTTRHSIIQVITKAEISGHQCALVKLAATDHNVLMLISTEPSICWVSMNRQQCYVNSIEFSCSRLINHSKFKYSKSTMKSYVNIAIFRVPTACWMEMAMDTHKNRRETQGSLLNWFSTLKWMSADHRVILSHNTSVSCVSHPFSFKSASIDIGSLAVDNNMQGLLGLLPGKLINTWFFFWSADPCLRVSEVNVNTAQDSIND